MTDQGRADGVPIAAVAICRNDFHAHAVTGSDTILLQLQLLRWRLFLRSCVGDTTRRRLSFGAATVFVCFGLLGGLWRQQSALAILAADHADAVRLLSGSAASLAGALAGRSVAAGARRDLAAAWLASLPWSGARRKRALLVSCLPALILANAMTVTTTIVACLLLRSNATGTSILAASLFTGLGFVFGLAMSRALAGTAVGPAAHPRRPSRILPRIDQALPSWIGNWALGGRGRRLALVWLVSLVLFGGLGIAGSLETGTAMPAACVGLAGSHAMFLFSFRCRPLRTEALRVLPVSFARAVYGMSRLPALASLGWFLPPGLAALVVAPGDPLIEGSLLGLILLNGSSALTFLWQADSPAAAMLLHITIVSSCVQYWTRLGLSELVIGAIMSIVFWKGARRRFVGKRVGNARRAA